MIEAAELNRLFLWGDEWQGEIDKENLEEELADIAIYLTYICMKFNINIEAAIHSKIIKNATKYPLIKINSEEEKLRARSYKYFE